MNKLYNEQDVQNIATAIREKNSLAPAAMKVREMDQAILDIPTFKMNMRDSEPWVRPDDWMDIYSVWEYDENNTGEIWLLYIKTPDTFWGYGIYQYRAHIEIGTIQNGTFTVIETLPDTNGNISGAFPDEYDQLVVHLTDRGTGPPSSVMDYFMFSRISEDVTGLNAPLPPNVQPCYEVVGTAPYLTINRSQGQREFTTYYLEHMDLPFGQKRAHTGTVLSRLFYRAGNLRKLELDNFNTSLWTITSLSQVFYECSKLQELDFSHIDTSNWAITDMRSLFDSCYNLRKINFGNMDTSNWAVTNMSYKYYRCFSLEELDLSFRDTSNWSVTSVYSAYAFCHSLKRINFGDIDTSNWPMNSTSSIGSSLFYYCSSLKEIDFSKFDTRNWRGSTSCEQMFTHCINLERVIFGPNVDTSGFKITSLLYAFAYCKRLQEINMEQLDIDVKNFTATNGMAAVFCHCSSLKKIDLSCFNLTDASAINNFNTIFDNCEDLEVIDFSSWNNNKMTAFVTSMFTQSVNLKEFHFPKYVSLSGSGTTTFFQECFNLTEIYPPENGFPNVNMAFIGIETSMPSCISTASLHRIIDALPTATGTKTLTIGMSKAYLAQEDIAIAAEKGWTIA